MNEDDWLMLAGIAAVLIYLSKNTPPPAPGITLPPPPRQNPPRAPTGGIRYSFPG